MDDKHGFLKDVTNWNNHRPLLLIALDETKTGNVLELGMGDGSTPYIYEYCKNNKRLFVTFENNRQYADVYIKKYDNENCIPCFTEDWDTTNIGAYKWAVALVDHAPGERRYIDIRKLKDICQIIVIHDSEPTSHGYALEKIWHLFKYRIDIKTDGAWASAVSNFVDLSKFGGMEIGQYIIS